MSKTITVWRLEKAYMPHKGNSPYLRVSSDNFGFRPMFKDDKFLQMIKEHNESRERPATAYDFKRETLVGIYELANKKQMSPLSGCRTLASLKDWFDGYWEYLLSLGFYASSYRIPEEHCWVSDSGRQIVFLSKRVIYEMTAKERESENIAKKLVTQLVKISKFDGDAAMILEDARIHALHENKDVQSMIAALATNILPCKIFQLAEMP